MPIAMQPQKNLTMNVIIRDYENGDLTAIAKLWLESWQSIGLEFAPVTTEAETRARILQELAAGWSVYVACSGDKTIVGFLALKPHNNCLDQLFVAPAAQRSGIGSALIEFAKHSMPAGMWLRTDVDNLGACRFYERSGFKRGEIKRHPALSHLTVTYHWP
jgi:ribosomal protein S18 acetylase RimI-like enzyme